MLLTVGYVVGAAVAFAALTVSPLELFSYPVVVSLWTAYLWVFTARCVRQFSLTPRPPRRVAAIIIGCGVVAFLALAASIVIGLLMVARRT